MLWEGQLVAREGGQEIIDEDWACVWTEFHNRSKLSSLVPDTHFLQHLITAMATARVYVGQMSLED